MSPPETPTRLATSTLLKLFLQKKKKKRVHEWSEKIFEEIFHEAKNLETSLDLPYIDLNLPASPVNPR